MKNIVMHSTRISLSLFLLLCPFVVKGMNQSPQAKETNAKEANKKSNITGTLDNIKATGEVTKAAVLKCSKILQEDSPKLTLLSEKIELIEKSTQEMLNRIEKVRDKGLVKHTIFVSPDLQRLESCDRFNDLKTLGGEVVALEKLPVLQVTKRDIDLGVEQSKANWSFFGASTKEARADILANDPSHTIPANQMFQARSDVNYMLGQLTHMLKARTTFEESQTSLAELKKQQVPLVEKISKLLTVGITDDKKVEYELIKQLEEQKKRIYKNMLLMFADTTQWMEAIQTISNHIYDKTKGDKEIVGAADNLNYKNLHLITALVLQYRKDMEDKKLAEEKKALETKNNNNNESSDKK